MNKIYTYIARISLLGSFFLPALALAQESVDAAVSSANLEALISAGYYISSAGFLIASIMMFLAVRKFGESTLGTIFSYLFFGTATFFVITIFQKLGGEYFGIGDDSMDVWWHVMFYTAFLLYFFGLKMLSGLGSSEQDGAKKIVIGSEKIWAAVTVIILAAVFILPSQIDPLIMQYNATPLSTFGLHHFIAFALAGLVAFYLISVRSKLGLIGKSIAMPLIVATGSLSLQHLWELQFESWKTVVVTSEVGEGVEKIFLTIASLAVIYAGFRLYNFAKK